ncbi:leucine-rich repeat and immunoglobulin-like domain-containing nogo receptor-interacting protein 1 [Anthonomus grandis grandis]|uniref:leucine-rich repeat and immunoglobulin-like domain-containing nogo receptor-interacting protein 1 n=1 Tax=Anthonomus grandis grandis TaxID=2921223 RepID=UPI00216644BF|nr:leucine-rich repeat and immunoglobulin-like domain-containing nogo receptor-interacting protein 1 [Anthonomus grandis grandis]
MHMGGVLATSCIFLLILIQVAFSTLLPSCPLECLCLSQTQVLCNSGGLYDIPLKQLPPTVEHLSLTRNQFPVVKSDSFAGLRFLKKLSLDGNNISLIKPFAFRGLPRLRDLSIQHTPLETVSPFAFAGLQNITSINLAYNKIKKIESYAFAGTVNLKQLILTHNPIIKLESNAFTGMTEIDRIVLPSGIRTIEPDCFNGLDTLGHLQLAFMDLRGLRGGIFRGLTNVNYLSIQESDLGIIEGDAFNDMTYVKSLNILNNKVDGIQFLNFSWEQHIGHLRFQGNHILEIPRAETLLIEVEKLTVIQNHFPCDCHIHSLLDGPLANGSMIHFISRNYCISPLEVNGAPMSNVDIDSIGRCQEEVTRGNLEATKDSNNSSERLTSFCSYLNLMLYFLKLLRIT